MRHCAPLEGTKHIITRPHPPHHRVLSDVLLRERNSPASATRAFPPGQPTALVSTIIASARSASCRVPGKHQPFASSSNPLTASSDPACCSHASAVAARASKSVGSIFAPPASAIEQ